MNESTENGVVETVKDEEKTKRPSDKKMSDEEIFAGSGAKGSFGTWMEPDRLVIVDDKDDGLFDRRGLEAPTESLIKSIEMNGILQNVVVHRNTETGKIEVVAGRRRVLAARVLKERGIPVKVPVIAKKGEMTSLIQMMLAENEHRKEDDPMNRARKMNTFINLGGSIEDLAVSCNMSVSTVKNVLLMLEAPVVIQKAAESKSIGAADGYKLAKLAKKDPDAAKEKLGELLAADADTTVPKKQRRAKKKAALAATTKSGQSLRGKKEISNKLKQLEEEEIYKAKEQEIVVGVLKWVLGNDRAIGTVCTKI